MGRLFQYNRFGAATDETNKYAQKEDNNKVKMQQQQTIRKLCNPAYAAIYASAFEKKLANGYSSSNNSTNSTSTSTVSMTTSPGYNSRSQETKSTIAAADVVSRTQKAYVCMKDFLKRKLFQQNDLKHETVEEQQDEHEEAEDATSNYDEQDMLDSSYNADEEENGEEEEFDDEEGTNCSCSYTTNCNDQQAPIARAFRKSTVTKSTTSQKSLLSLNCWQSSNQSETSSCSDTESNIGSNYNSSNEFEQFQAFESNNGISDCHQLISEIKKKSPKRRPPTPKHNRQQRTQRIRYNTNNDDDEEEELLAHHAWYQPRITAKAAFEHLSDASPGTFVLRQRNAYSYELYLRLECKVKQFTVLRTTHETYKFKGAKKEFCTLKAFVTHHSVMAEHLPLTLDMPREEQKEKTTIRYADDFEPLESLQLLGILKNLQARHIEW